MQESSGTRFSLEFLGQLFIFFPFFSSLLDRIMLILAYCLKDLFLLHVKSDDKVVLDH